MFGAFLKFHNAVVDLFYAICKELKVERILDFLEKLLEGI
jgi:hypothetical protein